MSNTSDNNAHLSLPAELVCRFQESGPAQQLFTTLRQDDAHVKGLPGSLKSLMLAALHHERHGQVVFISTNPDHTEEIKEDLEQLLGSECVAFFPPIQRGAKGVDLSRGMVKAMRLSAMEDLVAGKAKIVVLNAAALAERLPAPSLFQQECLVFAVGSDVSFDASVARLVDLGFVHESRVEQPGEICVRGGIVDIFPHSAELPYRLEFWGNTIESIRTFDPETQRSTAQLQQITVSLQDTDLLLQDAPDAATNILSYLQKDALIVLDEPAFVKREIRTREESEPDHPGQVGHDRGRLISWEQIEAQLQQHRQIRIVTLGSQHANMVDFQGQPQAVLGGDFKRLNVILEEVSSDLRSRHGVPSSCYFLCDSASQASRMETILYEEGIESAQIVVRALGLHHGFVFPDANLVVFTDHQFYGRSRRLRLPKRKTTGLTPRQLKQLNIGDFVVHVDYGIGRFLGLKKVVVRGREHECLHLEYKDNDKVYVRVERMDKVNKYSSKDGAQPTLCKLGSPEWQRLKTRTKKKIKDIAQELIKIYAQRKSQNGFAFAEDTLWQRELEASFPFEDTPDQLTATMEVKADMESRRPMDRLVCGDVGFGKTEIAVRAAFKAVENGKQVAMLVPTTILAYQHYNTFKDRLEKFPVRVEMLSRFKSAREQAEIVEKIKQGKVDIVVATHRLLSKDLDFADLGLLIIDEEQKFGVAHKEKLKKLRACIDVLTLTATPIPRTLQFSLMGARDMTNINTPPKNRLPIVTEILPFNKNDIREAIQREMERRGQVFFVHNRVHSIEKIAAMLARLVPEARIAIAHGQMKERQLERIMVEFMNRKYDILVSTMIIESGLDIPNVNTIIIDHADKLGLAQLYQLRGRVGRSHHRAYAYLLIPPVERLTDDALKRLHAIEEFSEIGSGGRLAMRDLEIRGAGNLLGAEQTGFIDALGFDLYNKILDEAVRELKSEHEPDRAVKPEFETKVEIDFDAYLPDAYISSGSERVDVYKRLTEAEGLDTVDEIRKELEDRFGQLPEQVENLLHLVALKILGQSASLNYIRVTGEEMIGKFAPEVLTLQGEHFKSWLGSILQHTEEAVEFFQEETLGLRYRFNGTTDSSLLVVTRLLQKLTSNQTAVHSSTREEDLD